MAVQLNDLKHYLQQYLEVDKIKDYCPNGLQVEGKPSVSRIIGGVTASQDLIDAAINQKADAVLVHHGYFWKGENACITGIKRNRIKALLQHDISLLAYHLPLDVHNEVGNNVQLADILGLTITGPLEPGNTRSVGLRGDLKNALKAEDFNRHISQALNRECFHVGDPSTEIKTVAWCTGAAQGMISQAIDLGVDAYISGEISEPTVHIARENNIHYFAAGHHATERYGVKALGMHLTTQFDVAFEFVDIDNPV